VLPPSDEMDWSTLNVPSPNGIFLVLMAISWFPTCAPHRAELTTNLVDDIIGILTTLLLVVEKEKDDKGKRKRKSTAGGAKAGAKKRKSLGTA
jgi:hypothetical protein